MKSSPTLLLLAALALAACTQEPPPDAGPQPENARAHEQDSELQAALENDDLPRATALYREGRVSLEHFAERSFSSCAGRCYSWALAQGYRPEITADYWTHSLPDWCCEVDEQEADKLRHVLIPLLKGRPELLQKEIISPVVIYLATFGCQQTMQQLLALGAPAEVEDAKGHTALDYALFYEYAAIAAMLRAHGATRHTPRPTAREVFQREWNEHLARQAQIEKEYQAALKARKPGEPLPPITVSVGPTHRPQLD